MSDTLKIMLENIEQLSPKEKALAVHCILTSMNPKSEDDVESDWLKLAAKRSGEMESGEAKSISWSEIKNGLVD